MRSIRRVECIDARGVSVVEAMLRCSSGIRRTSTWGIASKRASGKADVSLDDGTRRAARACEILRRRPAEFGPMPIAGCLHTEPAGQVRPSANRKVADLESAQPTHCSTTSVNADRGLCNNGHASRSPEFGDPFSAPTSKRAPSATQGQGCFWEYGFPKTADSASFGVSLRRTTSRESVRRRTREKSRYRP
jgi:hypothetical protein